MRSFKWIQAIFFLVSCLGLTFALNFLLEQYNVARVNVHRIGTTQYDDIFIGTSHGLSAINPEIIDRVTGRRSTNICMPDQHVIDSYFLVKEACRKFKPKRIIYELDPSYWSTKQNNGSNSVYIYKEFPFSTVKMEYFWAKIKEMDYRVTLAPWFYYRNCASKIKDTVKLKLSDEYKQYNVAPLNTGAQMYTEEGYMHQVADANADKGNPNVILWNRNKIEEIEVKYFKKLVEYCKKSSIELVVITTPVPMETLTSYQDVFEKSNQYYTELLKGYGVPYYDFNIMNLDGLDRSISGYLDYEGHMSGELGNGFSRYLGETLQNK